MFKNRKNKIISLLICLLFIVSLISIRTSKVEADTEVRTGPSFNLEYTVGNKISDSEIKVDGEVNSDIEIAGTITGLPFELDYPELVLVLDVSESMNEGLATDKSITKISKLKEATSAFIEKVKEIENLKIAIISYNSDAKLLTDGGFVDAKNNEALENAIKKIQVSTSKEIKSGTNTGEALRQALYLSNNSTASKTIVLMSDGLPTYCTVNSTNLDGNKPNYYTKINDGKDKIIWNSGSGLSDVYGFDLGYAKEMGKIIKDRYYSVYSIGYGLNDSGNNNLRSLHSEMLQTPLPKDNTTEDEKYGYYKANDNKPGDNHAIEDVFEKIAVDLLKKYKITDSNIQMTGINKDKFTVNNASLEGTEYKIPLTGLEYELEAIANGKYVYKGNSVDFNYTINGKEEKNDQKLYEKININYKWDIGKGAQDLNKFIFVDLFKKPKYLKHGFYYNVFYEGSPVIEKSTEDDRLKVTPGATYTFGAALKIDSKDINAKLDISKNISVDQANIVPYKIENGKLERLESSVITGPTQDNSFNIKLDGYKDGITNTTEILIVYKGIVNSDTNPNSEFENNITVNNVPEAVYMKTNPSNEPKLPDLF